MSLLNVSHLTVSFQNKKVVNDISFYVNKGECVALVGSSGSGKSVTALSILRLVQNAHVQGTIQLNDIHLSQLSDKQMQAVRGRHISMIFQEPMTSLNPLHKVGKQIKEVMKIHFQQSSTKTVLSLLNLVGLKNAREKINAFPHELSGGERQRVMIAMALAGNPELLIADEPTTALDVSIQKQILDLLKSLQKKLNLSILFISHDVRVVSYMAERRYFMKEGKIVPSLPTFSFETSFQQANQEAPVVLSLRNVSVFYRKFQALSQISFDVRKGETLGVVGESGSGKSTLAQAVLRLIPSSGTILVHGRNWAELSQKDLRRERASVVFVFQDPFSSLNPRFCIREIIEEGLKLLKISPFSRNKLILNTLRKVNLEKDILNRYPHELSGGQRQRVAFARAFILKPKILIMDEPTSALDVENQYKLLELLKSVQKEDKITYLFITHDMNVIKQMASHVGVLKEGRLVEVGPVQSVFEHPQQIYTRVLIQSALLERKNEC